MKVRILNEAGIDEFLNQLSDIRLGTRSNVNTSFLTQELYTDPFDNDVDVEDIHFKNKYEIIKYLCEKLSLKTNKDLYYHRGLWSWLAAFYFKILTSEKEGKRKVNEDAKYILMEPKNWRRYYRHLLASFARIYCELDDLAGPFLSYPIPIWSDFHEQLFAYQQIATNRPLIAAANKLYWDSEKSKMKIGTGSSGAGSPRRFSAIVGQFEVTYDLNAMSPDNILSLFPVQEFKKWSSVA
ncbi:MAG: hypothetical protein ACTHKV_00990 [Flavipsychrobacter sp.]